MNDKTPRLARVYSQAHADQYVRLGWVLRHEFKATDNDEPYEYVLEWPYEDSPPTIASGGDSLFGRVASILEQARNNVVRSVNTSMVLAYWLIGREIVQELQGGEDRAEYGKQVL